MFPYKNLLYFFLKTPALTRFLYFLIKSFSNFEKQNFLIFREMYIHNPGIFRTRGIFRTLVYSEPEAYSEHCRTSTIERFELPGLSTQNFFLKHSTLKNLNDCNGTRTHNHLVRKWTLTHLAKLTKMIELCYEYLSVRSIWLYVLTISRTCFRVNPHSIVA